MNQEEEVVALFEAIGQTTEKNGIVLVEGGDFTICFEQGRFIRHCPGAGKSWVHRKISPKKLLSIAPLIRILEVLHE